MAEEKPSESGVPLVSMEEAIESFKRERVESMASHEARAADEAHQAFIADAMKNGCPTELFAEWLWQKRCRCDHRFYDMLLSTASVESD